MTERPPRLSYAERYARDRAFDTLCEGAVMCIDINPGMSRDEFEMWCGRICDSCQEEQSKQDTVLVRTDFHHRTH